jgi:hypothetical protein
LTEEFEVPQEIFFVLQASYRHSYVVLDYSWRTAVSVVDHSQRFLESPKSIGTFSSISQRTADMEYRKIGELRTQLPILLRDSKKILEGLA